MTTSVLTTSLSTAPPAPFIGALRSEVIKTSSVRRTWILLAFNVVGGVGISFAVGTFVTDEVLVVAEVGFYWTVVTGGVSGTDRCRLRQGGDCRTVRRNARCGRRCSGSGWA